MEIKHRVQPQHAKEVRADLAKLHAAVAGDETVAAGDSGAAVSALQRGLRGLNLYDGKITGTFDAATAAAVKKLEAQSKDATADGAVDSAELAELKARQLFVKDDFKTPAKVGQKGSDIRELENKLMHFGYHPGKIDGVYDPKLEKAVRAYRKDDPKVSDKFHGAGENVIKGLRHQVHNVEANLKKLGGHPGKVDGFYGKQTEAAVKAFQRKHHLKPTGIANERTRNAIAKAAHGGISAATQKFIDVAKAQVGKPYVFGAEGPGAFDCSGLIDYALDKAGVDAPRKTADGYKELYQHSAVDRAHLKPGDLVFYYYPNSRNIPPGHASHIEIYLGHGKTMGTDNPDEGARIENIDWSAFIGGARVPGLQH